MPPASPFGSVLTAMITPFNTAGEVDYAVAEKLAVHLVKHGSDGLVVCGTTGESPTLTWKEEHELFHVVKQAVGKEIAVIAGTGSNCTNEAVEATQTAAKLGVDGSLQVVPYYNKPPQEGLFLHFQAIAESSPELPMMLYNIPGRTGCALTPETVSRLAKIDNIVAIKEATGSLDQASQVRALTPPDFAIYAGDDVLTLPILAVGGSGVVSVASHLVGDRLKQMISWFQQGHPEKALAIHVELIPLFKSLFCSTNPIPVKTALRWLGWQTGSFRPPLSELEPDQAAQLKTVMSQLKLLPSH